MLSPEERALALDMADKLIELYEQREEALDSGDLDRVYEVQARIGATRAARQVLSGLDC
jgi:hypothetical protein